MICKKCKKPLPDEALFCLYCGAAQANKPRNRKRRANGTGTVFRRGNYWQVQIRTKDGRTRSKSGFATKTDALAYIPTLQAEAAPLAKMTTFQSLWDYFEDKGLPKLSKDKQSQYRRAWDRADGLHGLAVDEVGLRDLQAVVDRCETYYPARAIKDLFSKLFEIAIAEKTVTVNLSKYLELPELRESHTIPLQPSDVTALWTDFAAAPSLMVGAMLTMTYTGMMPGEFQLLSSVNVNLKKRRISGAGLKTEKRKETPMIIPDLLVPVLQHLIDQAAADGRICRMCENEFYKQFGETVERLGLTEGVKPYSCRHTTATVLAEANVAAPIIKEVMRHANITTSQKYIHLSQEAEAGIVNQAFAKS